MDEPIKVYNFEVEDWHTYFVSDSGILVHNLCNTTPNTSDSSSATSRDSSTISTNTAVGEGGSSTSKNGVSYNPKTVRRFMSKQEYKQFKKNGFTYDPNDSRGGISTTTTNVKPYNPDAIKNKTGALGADYYVDIDVSNKNVFYKGPTKSGLPDWKIKDNVDVIDIVGSGKVRK